MLDKTPPVPGPLAVRMEHGPVQGPSDAQGGTSPIAWAEGSLGARLWKHLVHIDTSLDQFAERCGVRFSLLARTEPVSNSTTTSSEHGLVVRACDCTESMTRVEAVLW